MLKSFHVLHFSPGHGVNMLHLSQCSVSDFPQQTESPCNEYNRGGQGDWKGAGEKLFAKVKGAVWGSELKWKRKLR